jgi:uncharacterized protein (TIGR02453 family)
MVAGMSKASSTKPFSGFPAEAFEFYDALVADNTREWWQQHKPEYEQYVRGPLVALLSELEPEFGPAHLFRPYRDTRFSKDKTPIKDHQGAVVSLEDAVGYYVQISAQGLMVAGGWYAPQGQQIARYREAVDGPRGAELESLVAKAGRRFHIDGQPLKTRPKGYDLAHPRIELLRFRALTVDRHHPAGPELGGRKALNLVRSDWRSMRPLLEWLADNVGPGAEPGS